MYILGISAFYHDSAACIIKNSNIIAASQEERFTRIKHDSGFPTNSVKFCLSYASIDIEDVDYIVFYEKPIVKFERLIETYLAFAPTGFKSFFLSLPVWVKEKIFQKKLIEDNLKVFLKNKKFSLKKKILFSDHHSSHSASAFFPSPFEKSAILTMDGVGEWVTTSISEGEGNKIKLIKEINFPHSLGLLYSSFTYYLGFKVNSGEYKVMGLAPYGNPKYADLIRNNLIDIKDDGSFKLDMSYFNYCTGLTMTNKKFNNLFNGPPRKSDSKIAQKEMDLAASIQKVVEEIVVKIADNIVKTTGHDNLCLAGGVALNCVINGILVKKKIFNNIWIQPAAGDAGGALGAALNAYYLITKSKRNLIDLNDKMQGSYLGPNYSNDQIKKELNNLNAKFKLLNNDEIINQTAIELSNGSAVGWMNGRMEFGPRALGSRSILADPRSEKMQKNLNLKVKFRESFRPFAPSVLKEYSSEWFEYDGDSPYMLIVSNILEKRKLIISDKEKNLFGIEKLNVARSQVPAITHVDYSARIQTVHKNTNLKYYNLIKKFYEITNCPILVNTSFNVRGEPIVCSPTDAFRCFMGTDLDILVIGDFLMKKEDQDKSLVEDYKNKYELD